MLTYVLSITKFILITYDVKAKRSKCFAKFLALSPYMVGFEEHVKCTQDVGEDLKVRETYKSRTMKEGLCHLN